MSNSSVARRHAGMTVLAVGRDGEEGVSITLFLGLEEFWRES